MLPKLIVIAKAPRAGRSKTRLCPPCTPAQAAELAEAALTDTLTATAGARCGGRLLALEGPPGRWLRPGFAIVPQRAGGLAERLAGAFDDAGGPALLIGMDTPQVTSAALDRALADLMRPATDAVIGPAPDGGYWAIGLRRADPRVFEDVAMSTCHTYRDQLAALERLGLRVRVLPELRDFDLIGDARAVAAVAPGTRFARTLESIEPALGQPMSLLAAADIFGRGLVEARRAPRHSYRAVADDGTARSLPLRRWVCRPAAEEERLLAESRGPVLDVGCGAGRHLSALRRSGTSAVGVEICPAAVALARRDGNVVLEGSIFSELPAWGGWGTALLLDGNIGIGGDPAALLRRLAGLLDPGGSVVAELEPPGRRTRSVRLRIEGGGAISDWFPWAWVGVDNIRELAGEAELATGKAWSDAGRWFARLDHLASPTPLRRAALRSVPDPEEHAAAAR